MNSKPLELLTTETPILAAFISAATFVKKVPVDEPVTKKNILLDASSKGAVGPPEPINLVSVPPIVTWISSPGSWPNSPVTSRAPDAGAAVEVTPDPANIAIGSTFPVEKVYPPPPNTLVTVTEPACLIYYLLCYILDWFYHKYEKKTQTKLR